MLKPLIVRIRGDIDKLGDFLDEVGEVNTPVPSTVVLSSYQTWARRTTKLVDMEGNTIRATRQESSRTARPAADPKTLDPEAEAEEFDEDVLTGEEEEEELSTPSPPTDDIRDQLADLQDAESGRPLRPPRRPFVASSIPVCFSLRRLSE
jgi:hypothetical protein